MQHVSQGPSFSPEDIFSLLASPKHELAEIDPTVAQEWIRHSLVNEDHVYSIGTGSANDLVRAIEEAIAHARGRLAGELERVMSLVHQQTHGHASPETHPTQRFWPEEALVSLARTATIETQSVTVSVAGPYKGYVLLSLGKRDVVQQLAEILRNSSPGHVSHKP